MFAEQKTTNIFVFNGLRKCAYEFLKNKNGKSKLTLKRVVELKVKVHSKHESLSKYFNGFVMLNATLLTFCLL